jgi:hypothetical protein
VANMKTAIAIRAGHSPCGDGLGGAQGEAALNEMLPLLRARPVARGFEELMATGQRRTIMDATVQSLRQQLTRATCVSSSRSMLCNWKLWLVFAAVAIAAGAAFNWSWLLVAGAAPLLLSVLPCLAMCALHLCANKSAGNSCADHDAGTSGHQLHAARSLEQVRTGDNRP